MKKIRLIFLGLFCAAQVSVFGQLYVRVETAPTMYLPSKGWKKYIDSYQLHYKNGQFLRLKMGKYFYAGIGIQEEQIFSCADCLMNKKPDYLQLAEISRYNYVAVDDSCTARSLRTTTSLTIPLELGFTYRRKKSPLGLNVNARIYGFGHKKQTTRIRGDTVFIDNQFTYKYKSLYKHVDWQLAAGASYRLNKRTFLSADLAWTTYWLSDDHAIGINIGLDYALTKP